MIPASILIPLVLAVIAASIPSNRWRPLLLPLGGVSHFIAVLFEMPTQGDEIDSLWISLDPLGKLVLALVSFLFFLCSIYAVGYLKHRQERSNRIFCGCALAFQGMLSLVCWSQHLGLMWIALDATTLASAPLIYFNRTRESIEAAWKYLMICSVGLALALLGSLFLSYASLHGGLHSSLVFRDLLAQAPSLSKPWLHAGFVLLLVGYGAKMGLAPMHTWKPEAYGESAGVIAALMAGGLTSCAFLAILRVSQICQAAGEFPYASRLLIFIGLLSMAVAALSMFGERDFKKLLAYSSVEHMGILALGIGVGGAGAYGALLHLINNALSKGLLFLAAGNIHRSYGSKSADRVTGALTCLPFTAWMFLLGFLAVSGSPPFGPFISLFRILCAMAESGRYISLALSLIFLLLVFIGMGGTVFRMLTGKVESASGTPEPREGFPTLLPMALLLVSLLVLGIHPPATVAGLLEDAFRFLEMKP